MTADTEVNLRVRACGAVHTDGVTCTLSVMWEPGCCHDIVYEHESAHEAHYFLKGKDLISHRWREVLVVQDEPFNAYGPLELENDDAT